MSNGDRIIQTPRTPKIKTMNSSDIMSPLIKTPKNKSPLLKKSHSSYPDFFSNLSSPRIVSSPLMKRPVRNDIPTKPYFTYDIGHVIPDFYRSPLDWSAQNIIGMIGQKKPLLYNLDLNKSIQIFYPFNDCNALKFSPNGGIMALGSDNGVISIFSFEGNQIIASYQNNHTSVNSIEYNNNCLISSNNDGTVTIYDDRDSNENPIILQAFESYVITTKINPTGNLFMVSSDSPIVRIWDFRKLDEPYCEFSELNSTVRAVDWNPLQPNIAAVGGGFEDRQIKIFNSDNGKILSCATTTSQICNIFWNKDYNEIVATHGFTDYHISLWRASDLRKLSTINVNHDRVLYAAMSRDNSRLVTSSPKDPLMFWLMFPKSATKTDIESKFIR